MDERLISVTTRALAHVCEKYGVVDLRRLRGRLFYLIIGSDPGRLFMQDAIIATVSALGMEMRRIGLGAAKAAGDEELGLGTHETLDQAVEYHGEWVKDVTRVCVGCGTDSVRRYCSSCSETATPRINTFSRSRGTG
jgi:hypothetical protein